MKLVDCVAEMARRVEIKDLDVYKDDMERAGLKDGPALQDAFDSWAASRKGRYPPTPREFKDAHYVERTARSDGFKSNSPRWCDVGEQVMEAMSQKLERERAERRAAMTQEQRDDEDERYQRALQARERGLPVKEILFGQLGKR